MSLLPRLLQLALCALALPAGAAGFDVDTLMGLLAAQGERHARFTEKKYLAVLDQPVESSGTLAFAPPDRLERRTLQPRAETLQVAGDELRLERDGRSTSLRLSSMPEVMVLVDSLRDTLAGNRRGLEQDYALHLSGSHRQWSLALLPSDPKVAQLVLRVTISGRADKVDQVEILQGDGDRSVMRIQPEAAR